MKKIFSSYISMQVVAALVSIIKIPATISIMGLTDYGVISVCIGTWILISLPGEAFRRQVRLSVAETGTFAVNKLTIILDSLLVVVVAGVLMILFQPNSPELRSNFIRMMSIFLLCGIFNIYTSALYGFLEGKRRIWQTNLLYILSHLISLPIYLLSLSTKSFVSIGIAIAFSYQFVAALFLLYMKSQSLKFNFYFQTFSDIIGMKTKWVALQVFELLSFALYPFFISIKLGSEFAAEYSIYQKFLLVGTAASASLSPLISSIPRKSANYSSSRKIWEFNVISSILIILGISIFGSRIFAWVSNGELAFNSSIALFAIAAALSGSMTSYTIQSSNSGSILKFRVWISAIVALCSIMAVWFSLDCFGIGTAFAIQALSTFFTFCGLKLYIHFALLK